MNKGNFNFTIFTLLNIVFLSSCKLNQHNADNNYLSNVYNKIIVPAKINWNINKVSDEYIVSSSNFCTFYFLNDTTIFMFRSLNNFQNDSILFGVENVEEFKGNFRLEQNNMIILNMHRLIDSFAERHSEIQISDSLKNLTDSADFILDTLNIVKSEKGLMFVYKNEEFKNTNKFTKGSLKKLDDLIY